MQIAVTPLDSECVLDVNTGIDTSVCNVGTVTEGIKRHFRARELGQDSNAGYLIAETLQKNTALYTGAVFTISWELKKHMRKIIFFS